MSEKEEEWKDAVDLAEFEILPLHHINGPLGELITFPCPHCNKEVFVRVKAMGDEENLEAWWGKTAEEIDEKQEKFQRAMEEEAREGEKEEEE